LTTRSAQEAGRYIPTDEEEANIQALDNHATALREAAERLDTAAVNLAHALILLAELQAELIGAGLTCGDEGMDRRAIGWVAGILEDLGGKTASDLKGAALSCPIMAESFAAYAARFREGLHRHATSLADGTPVH
jgi:hypothetical protein